MTAPKKTSLKSESGQSSRLRHPLLKKIHLLVSITVFLAVSSITFVTIVQQTKSQRSNLLAKNQLILKQLSAAVNSAFYTLNWVFVEKSLKEAAGPEDIVRIVISKPDGEIYLSSDGTMSPLPGNVGSGLTWIDRNTFYMNQAVPIGKESWRLTLHGNTAPIVKKNYQILYVNLIWGFAIIILSSFGAFFLSKRLTRSLSELSTVTEKIGRGEFGIFAEITSQDEIGQLAENINAMSLQLQKLYQNQQNQNRELEQKIRERTGHLRKMHKRLENILETTAQGFWRIDNELITREVNPRMAEILGKNIDEMIGRPITDLVDKTTGKMFLEHIQVIDRQFSSEFEIEVTGKNGVSTFCLFNATALFDDEQQKNGAFAMVTDLSNLKAAEGKLLQEKRKAEQASQAKTTFLAGMSHEIRTPLNGIIGSLELLNNHALPDDKQRHLLATAQKSADFLLLLLNDILDLSKIESGKIDLEESPFSPAVLVDQLHSMFITQVTKKGLQLKCAVHKSVPAVLIGDACRLQQICANLLSNALKFTSQGTISITLATEPCASGHVFLSGYISDMGIGIPEDKQQVIFDSFSQADTSTTRLFGGTGLGLALCKKLCALMGGEIEVESREERGSVFHFKVRLKVGVPDQLPEQFMLETISASNGEDTTFDILVVDDNEVNRDVVGMLLEQQGHQVVTATNGLEGLQYLVSDDFDCILMDIHMPVMDGLAATGIIRACEQESMDPPLEHEKLLQRLHDKRRGTHISIIALTANVLHTDRKKYLQAGMDAYLGKPIRPHELSRVLTGATKKHCRQEKKGNPVREVGAVAPVSLVEIREHLQTTYPFTTEQVDKLLAVSIVGIREGLDTLNQACSAADMEQLAASAHKLKGTLVNLGLKQLAEKAQTIERTAREEIDGEYDRWIDGLSQALQSLLKKEKN